MRYFRYLSIFLILFSVAFVFSPPVHADDSAAVAKILNTPPKDQIGLATQCAVCGMKLHVKSDTPVVEYKGKDYYFCDNDERDAFAKDPSQYLKK